MGKDREDHVGVMTEELCYQVEGVPYFFEYRGKGDHELGFHYLSKIKTGATSNEESG